MRLSDAEASERLRAHHHGVLSTLHPRRGPDPVPVVYAADADGFIGVPIDRVKPKSSTRLQRERNLAADPRASLLIEQWDADDWTRLWWVRATLQWEPMPEQARAEAMAAALAASFEQYADRPFERILVLRLTELAGWSAT